ncbi:MAG: hypothetical protein HRU11_04850 [Parvularculaceae bacterium]|nr:hypothetical protein [Parvularculaceae bacterium]
MDLQKALQHERLSSYARLGGGWPVPLAGGLWWVGLAYASTVFGLRDWLLVAFVTTGAIFPVALLIAKLAGNPFIKDRTALTSLLVPAFVGMLLFWPGAITAYYEAPELAVMLLAIGMSVHWPVIGWSYGRAPIFLAHCLVRAVAVTAIWWAAPDVRVLGISLVVAAIYFVTVAVLMIDSRMVRSRLAGTD